MTESPEVRDTRAYREALAATLTQFMHGEEISFTAVPIGLEHARDEALRREVERQLEDEKRHHKMFDAERVRLGLPREEPVEAMVRFHDTVIARLGRGDVVGGVIAGCFMLEGAALSTLLAHSTVVEPTLARVYKEILSDEGRHVTLNISVVRDMVGDDPRKMAGLVEVHRETLPILFQLFESFQAINDALGIDNEWFTMRCLFHHSQRIRRLHLPNAVGKAMLADTIAAAHTTK
jgi:hypothetical protein